MKDFNQAYEKSFSNACIILKKDDSSAVPVSDAQLSWAETIILKYQLAVLIADLLLPPDS